MDLSINKNTLKNTEKMELDVIDGILPSLLNKGCLTDIECRIIASAENLSERKSAIYDILMSKTNEDSSKLIAVLKTSTLSIRAKENAVFQNLNCNKKQNDPTSSLATVASDKTNPFLNNTVIKNLYAFLRSKDIKNCRLVCRQWNSTAEICLRKRSIIHFRPNVLQPSTFLQIAKYSLPNLPYRSFKFSSTDSPWSIVEIQEFFDKYGENIKELALEGIILTDRKDAEVFLPSYDVSPWFANCSGIETLKMDTSQNKNATPLYISLDKLTSIKTVVLRKCRIIMDDDYENHLMTSNSISLIDVNIHFEGMVREQYYFDGFIDFSNTESAVLVSSEYQTVRRFPMLYMKSQVYNINRLYLTNIEVQNWAEAKGEVQFLRVQGFDFIQKNELKIKELVVVGKYVIDLSALPQTIEKLKLLENNQIICTSEPIELPNIKYLLFDIVDNNSHLLTHFTNCSNLTELELDGSEDAGKLYLSCIPKSVKKVKLNCVHIKFVDYYILELDTLILDDKKHISKYSDFQNIITKMKAKNLVVVLNKKTELPAADIMRLVEAYNDQSQSQKIIIGSSPIVFASEFEVSAFSRRVDRKSKCYVFENKIGKAIPKMQFNLFKTLDEIKCLK